MYYPEANVLVPRDVDPRLKAFKSALIEVLPEAGFAARRRLPMATVER